MPAKTAFKTRSKEEHEISQKHTRYTSTMAERNVTYQRQAIHREEQAKAITQRQQDAERQAIHREEQTQATIQRRQHDQTTTNPSSDSGSRSIYFQ
jgi:hypothetical protein